MKAEDGGGEEGGHVDRETFRVKLQRFGELGFLGGPAPEGMGVMPDRLTASIVLSKLAEKSASFAAAVAVHYAAVETILALPGGAALPGRAGSGEDSFLLCGLLIESGIGRGDGTAYCVAPVTPLLAGAMLFLPGPDGGGAILMDEASKRELYAESLSLSGCLDMEPVRTPKPAEKEGDTVFRNGGDLRRYALDRLRLYWGAVLQGNARAAADDALEYATQRFQTGRPIVEHQNVRRMLLEMEMRNQAVASFLYRAALNEPAGPSGCTDLFFAFACGASCEVCVDAVQCLGGYGYMKDYPQERRMRDAYAIQALMNSRLSDWIGLPG